MCKAPSLQLQQTATTAAKLRLATKPERSATELLNEHREVLQALKLLHDSCKDPATVGRELWDLLPNDQQNMLVTEWVGYDLDGDDCVTKVECRNAQIAWYKSVFGLGDDASWIDEIDERVDEFFEHDVDNDGKVSWEEWMHSKAATVLSKENRLHQVLSADEKVALACIFKNADRNGDGMITRVEALSYYQIRLEHMIMHGIVPDLKSHERSEWVQRTVQYFFDAHGCLDCEGIDLDEFCEREAKFVIMDRFSKQANQARKLAQRFDTKLGASLDSALQPLKLDQARMEHARLLFQEHARATMGMSFSELKGLLKTLKVGKDNFPANRLRKVQKQAFKAADKDRNNRLNFVEFLAAYSFFYVRFGDFGVFAEANDGISIATEDKKERYFFNPVQLENFAEELEQKNRHILDSRLRVPTSKPRTWD